jgi:hypothetical protein
VCRAKVWWSDPKQQMIIETAADMGGVGVEVGGKEGVGEMMGRTSLKGPRSRSKVLLWSWGQESMLLQPAISPISSSPSVAGVVVGATAARKQAKSENQPGKSRNLEQISKTQKRSIPFRTGMSLLGRN